MPPRIGITLGDLTGIGPEVTLKALAAELHQADASYVILGDAGGVNRLNDQFDLRLPLAGDARFTLVNPFPEPLPADLPAGAPLAARAAVAWLEEGARRCLAGELDAIVTAPVNKHAIVQAGIPFVGQTEFFSRRAGTDHTAMMLLGVDDRGRWLRVALASTHLPLRRVADSLSQSRIEQVIELTARACADLRLGRRRVAVCGLNPHAGESGEFGTEEQEFIQPAVAAARERGLDVTGPLPADTVFYRAFRGEFEAIVAMYHDQGLGPLKMIGFDNGVNWTLGLPFVRTSPDHGTAYDIAGRGRANPGSMIAALRLARQLANR